MSTLPQRFGRNVTSGWARIATQIVIALVMTPVLVHGLGKTEYGIWALALSMILYLELFEFGLGSATVKYVAQNEALGDRPASVRSIATSFWTLAALGVLTFAIAVILSLLFPVLFDVPPESERAAQLLVLLVGLDLAVSIPSDTFGNTLLAMQRVDVINATLIAVVVAQAVAWAVVLWLGGGLVALAVVTVALSLVGQAARFVAARRLLAGLSLRPRFFDRALVRPLAGLSVWYALCEAAVLAVARLDTVVVGLVVGIPEAAVYAVAQKAAFLVDQVVRPMLRMFFPHSSDLAAREDRRALAATLVTGTRVAMAIAGPLTLTLGLFAEPALRAWVGDDFAEGAIVVVFLCAAAAIWSFSGTGFLMLQGAGVVRRPALISSAEAVLNIALSVVLGSQMGIKGVALATLIAASIFQLGLLFPYAARVFSVRPARLLADIARAHVPAAAAAVLVGWAVLRSGVSGAAVAPGGALVATAYVAVLAITGIRRDEWRLALTTLRTRGREPAAPV